MEFEKLKEVNARINKVDIKGKAYSLVNDRVMAFRELYPEGVIESNILSMKDGVVVIKTTVKDGEKVIATGLAYEKEGSTYINKTSYIENCETSAVGRALGFLGIGVDDSICSAEELVNAVTNQNQKQKKDKEDPVPMANKAQLERIRQIYEESVDNANYIESICPDPRKLTMAQATWIIGRFKQ